MQRSSLAVTSLVLAGVSVSCYKPLYFPPFGPIELAVALHEAAGKCTTETFPKYQPVRKRDQLVWRIYGVGKCTNTNDVTVQFPPDSKVVSLTPNEGADGDSRQIKGTVIGDRGGRYKYSILLGKVPVEDPEIEIWP